MPYKDPERKRGWEQEHRAQRNAQKRQRRLTVRNESSGNSERPDPASSQKAKSAWKTVFEWAAALGILALSVWSGVSGASPDPDRLNLPPDRFTKP